MTFELPLWFGLLFAVWFFYGLWHLARLHEQLRLARRRVAELEGRLGDTESQLYVLRGGKP